MLPIMLDPARLQIGLVGRADLALRRLAWFERQGVNPGIFSDAPSQAFGAAARERLIPRLPDSGDLAALDVLWIADLDPASAAGLAARARAAKVLVNVEDEIALCDFHTPSVVTRGSLSIAAGTGGASPAVASVVREILEETFPVSWETALADIASARARLRAAGAAPAEIAADARARLAAAKLI